jgi:chromosome segregation ATPase
VTGGKKNKGNHGVQAIHLIELSLAALGGGVVGALGYRFRAQQQLRLLQQRLLRSEEARNGAIERSANAREQIAQLSKAISELRRAHQPARAGQAARPSSTAEERRAAAEQALARAGEGRHEANEQPAEPVVFAPTQPMTQY